MTLRELRDALKRAGIRERAYDIEESSRDEVYCVDRVRDGWVVYYRERGIRRDEEFFSSEDEACRSVLGQILRDPTTRM